MFSLYESYNIYISFISFIGGKDGIRKYAI